MSTLLERPAPVAAPPPTPGRGSGWRPALRIARRELLRAKGRTLLVLLMVLLPVTAVVTLDTWLRTHEVDVVEGLPRDLGEATARIDVHAGDPVQQSPDLSQAGHLGTAQLPAARPTEAELRAVLPPGARLLPVADTPYNARAFATDDGQVIRAFVLGVDLSDPDNRGPFQVLAGQAPGGPDEIAIGPGLRADVAPGDVLRLPGSGSPRTVTGVVAVPRDYPDTAVVGVPEAVGLTPEVLARSRDMGAPDRYYVSGAPVSWDDVLELNALGAFALSRAVVLDPPPDSAVPPVPDYGGAATTAAIIGLIVVMAVLEVVLLAGPAFAVGARRQRRALALLAASGGEPRHVRRVVLAQGGLVGLAAAAIGVPLGIALAAVGLWAGQRWFPEQAGQSGPFDVSALDITLVALLGAGTALLAAGAPAWIAGRQPVVAALHGRRLVPARTPVPTVAGLVLLLIGVLLCLGSFSRGFPELWIAASAVPTVLGAVLLSPVLLAGLGRLAGRFPLPLRYAVRDADRQRGRTAPAVAAIAATVSAVVALGTAAASDEAESRQQYAVSTPVGAASVTAYGVDPPDWDALAQAARTALPGEPVTVMRGVLQGDAYPSPDGTSESVEVCRPDEPAAASCAGFAGSYGGSLGSTILVGTDALRALAPLLDPATLPAAERAVAGDGAAVVTPAGPARAGGPAGAVGDTVELRRVRQRTTETGGTRVTVLAEAAVPAVRLASTEPTPPLRAVLSESVAERLGGAVPVGLLVGDDLTADEEQRLTDALALTDPAASVFVERGRPEQSVPVVLILGLVAGALVLAGTLAASSLALTEARPDFTTLGSVGAPPRTRRVVAGAYAFTLALVGAVLGTLAGLVPGVAAAVSLTRWGYAESVSGLTAYDGSAFGVPVGADPLGRLALVVVPWPLLAALLVALPLLAGAVAAATTRSRLPELGRRVMP